MELVYKLHFTRLFLEERGQEMCPAEFDRGGRGARGPYYATGASQIPRGALPVPDFSVAKPPGGKGFVKTELLYKLHFYGTFLG